MFILFGGSYYYPAGGWKDVLGTFDSADEAKNNADRKMADGEIEWWQIVDPLTGLVEEGGF